VLPAQRFGCGASSRFTINASGTVKQKWDMNPPMITTGSV
jgi:hypothetical protein